MKIINKVKEQDLDDIEKKIFQQLKEFFEKDPENGQENRRGYWTSGVKEIFKKISKSYSKKCLVLGSNKGFDEQEWLYDLIWWYEEEKEDGEFYLKSIELIMECEWSQDFDDIRRDFEKLLICNCKRKVMICNTSEDQNTAANQVNKYMAYFQKAISNYDFIRSDERFLILIYNEALNSNDDKKWTYKVFAKALKQ